MEPSTRDNTKRKKRPAETGTLVGVRLQSDLLTWIDVEREKLDPKPSRPEFIRKIIEDRKG